MALQLKDRIYTNCSTIGKADIEIGATKEGYQGWEAITDGSTVYYCITDDTAWEVGYGVKTGTEIVRNLLSSNTGSLLSLNGNSSVFCTYPAEKAVFLNLDGNIHFPSANVTANTFVGKGSGITNINAETNNLTPEAPNDGETYARNNKTWVSISDSAGIPDAPVDNLQYGRQNGEWTEVESGTNGYTKAEIDAQQNAQDVNITANTNAIANLPSPVDTYTKAEINASQDAQDVEIAKKSNTSDTYTKTQTDTLLDNKANVGDSYTKAETYTSVEVDSKLFEKADKTTTYTKTEIDNSQDAQDTNISNNTSAIGTLSGRVSANEQDIATLQDGIFFSSSYTTDYPSNPNRDPEKGNIYLQDLSAFTYSYADANQVFISKTDEQGNVRQFTAVKPDDILVLNQVESPNYGRYKVSSVNDVGDYVNVIVEFQVGEGTVLEGDTLALQAFPASEGGTGGGIPEAPIDGKQYGRQDATWTEVTGGGDTQPSKLYTATLSADTPLPNAVQTKVNYTGENWADGVFTATEKGVYDITVGFQWTLVNPIDNQTYRNCYIYINGIMAVENSHGVDVSYPYGSCNQTQWLADLNVGDKVEIRANQANVNSEEQGLLVSGPNQFVNIALLGSGTGGGSYTPEAMVWENVTADRVVDSTYTNDNDVPLYVQIDTTKGASGANFAFEIDGNRMGKIGTEDSQCSLFIVPAKATYKLIKMVADGTIENWNEAKMPVAIGTGGGSGSGGKAIAFNALLTSAQTIPPSLKTTIFYDDIKLDTDSNYNSATGKYTIQSDGIYRIGASVNLKKDNSLIDALAYLNINSEVVQRNRFDFDASKASSSFMAVNIDYVADLKEGDEVYISAYGRTTDSSDIDLIGGADIGNVFNIIKVSGGSGGGSYTPESLVWEDKKLENDFDVLYTNDSDVPRYVEISLTSLEETEYAYANFLIDGKYHASMGKRGSGIRDMSQGMFIVPAGSTYNLEKDGNVVIGTWWEARMPVAVGTGGGSGWEETVLFENATGTATDFSLSESYDNFDYLRFDTIQPSGDNLKRSDMFPVNICDKLVIDNYFNYYMWLSCDDKTNFTVLGADNVSLLKVVGINTGSGGGSGGDSIWTDVDGDAVLETDGKKLTIDANVGELGLKSRITTDASTLELKAGSGGIADVTITDAGLSTVADITVNGMTVGASSSQKNTFIGKNALASRTNGMFCVAVGEDALKNSAEGGAYNTAIGYNAGGNLTTGSGNICIGYQAQASSPTVTNEVTIGSDDVTSTRLKGQVTMNDNLTINTGDLKIPNIAEAGTPANVYISGAGTIHRSTASTYTTEEVDKKLAIKDKLIEKLSARLDELEKKVK